VTFKADVNLTRDCVPSISLSGLLGATTQTGTIQVSFEIPDGASTLNYISDASWNKASGSLTATIMQTAMPPISGEVKMTFSLKNPNLAQQAPSSVTLTLRLDDVAHDPSDHTSISQELTTAVSDLEYSGKSQCARDSAQRLQEKKPLYVQAVSWSTGQIGQNSSYPCSDNFISITLRTNGPLFDCVSKITVRGLTGSTTGSQTNFMLTSKPDSGMISSTSNWTNSGVLILNKTSTFLGCQDIVFSFKLKNPPRPQSSPEATVSFSATSTGLSNVIQELNLTRASGLGQPLLVADTSLASSSISSSSTAPCGENKISVTLQFVVPLLCNDIKLVISRIGKSRTPSGLIALDTSSALELYKNASWNQTSEEISVKPVADLWISSQYVFSFNIINADSSQNAVTGIQIKVVGQGSEASFSMAGEVTATVAASYLVSNVSANSSQVTNPGHFPQTTSFDLSVSP